MKLKQRRLLHKRTFEIGEFGLDISDKAILSSVEYQIPFEEILIEKKIKNTTKNPWFFIIAIISSIALLINLVGTIFESKDFGSNQPILIQLLVLAIASTLSYILYKDEVLIPTLNDSRISLFNSYPSRHEVNEFLNTLEITIKKFLKEKYGNLNLNLSIDDQIKTLKWLRNRNIITQDELDKELMKLDINKTKEIGFK